LPPAKTCENRKIGQKTGEQKTYSRQKETRIQGLGQHLRRFREQAKSRSIAGKEQVKSRRKRGVRGRG
jgi:hypothetical protein